MKFCTVLKLLASFLLSALFLACDNDDGYQASVKGSVMQFSFHTVDGDEVSSDQLSGCPYMLVVFNTRCGDCQKELPVIDKVAGLYGGKIGLVILSYSQTKEDVGAYWSQNGFSMPFEVPSDNDICRRLAPEGIPQIYVVSSDGIVMSTFNDKDMPDFDTLCQSVEQCLGQDTSQNETVSVQVRLRAFAPVSEISGDNSVIASESLVSNVRLYFFNSDTRTLVAIHDIDDIKPLATSFENQYDITYLLPAVNLPLGYYDLFTIANYDNFPEDIETEDDLLALQDSLSYSTGIMSTLSENGSIMSSCPVENLRQDFTNKQNTHVIVNVNLERVVAKVILGKSNDAFELSYKGETYATINLSNYKFVNLNTRFFLFKHTAVLSDFIEPERYCIPDNFYSEIDGDNVYVIDPLFFKKDGTDASYTFLRGIFQNHYSDNVLFDFAGFPAAGQYATAYLLENNAFCEYQTNGTSTGIVFKASVIPSFVYLYDAKSGEVVKEERPETYSETLYLYNYKFFNSIKALNIVSGLMLDELKKYTDAELAQYGIKQVHYYMGVFETYYSYWIRHSELYQSLAYGIVRNNFYKLQVTSITDLGKSTVDADVKDSNSGVKTRSVEMGEEYQPLGICIENISVSK